MLHALRIQDVDVRTRIHVFHSIIRLRRAMCVCCYIFAFQLMTTVASNDYFYSKDPVRI